MPNEFEWDDVEAAANVVKHGVTFPTASQVFRDPRRTELVDPRGDYGEARWIRFGRVRGELLAVVFTRRGTPLRIISARRANRGERRRRGYGSDEPRGGR